VNKLKKLFDDGTKINDMNIPIDDETEDLLLEQDIGGYKTVGPTGLHDVEHPLTYKKNLLAKGFFGGSRLPNLFFASLANKMTPAIGFLNVIRAAPNPINTYMSYQKSVRTRVTDWQDLEIFLYYGGSSMDTVLQYAKGWGNKKQYYYRKNKYKLNSKWRNYYWKKLYFPVKNLADAASKLALLGKANGKYTIKNITYFTGHGSPGKMQVGNEWLDTKKLKKKLPAYIKLRFSSKPALKIFACETAKGYDGEEFLWHMGYYHFNANSGTVTGLTTKRNPASPVFTGMKSTELTINYSLKDFKAKAWMRYKPIHLWPKRKIFG
jgi:hypothetical protein